MGKKFVEYIPNIDGFSDFCSWLMDGKTFLWCNGHLMASFDINTRLDMVYNFVDIAALIETEKAIKNNWYMFETEKTNKFFSPNDNMFSGNNSRKNIEGYIVHLKKQYRH